MSLWLHWARIRNFVGMELTPTNLTVFAARHYDNPGCLDDQEFEDDLLRLTYLARLFNRYSETGNIKERLAINHFVVLFNVFPTSIALQLIFFKLSAHLSYVKPFLIFLNKCPEVVFMPNSVPIHTANIIADETITQQLRRL